MDWTSTGPILGPIAEEFIYYVFLVCTRLIVISSLAFYALGCVRPLLCLWMCWGTEYFIFQIFVPSGYYVCGVLLNGFLSIYLGRYMYRTHAFSIPFFILKIEKITLFYLN